MHRYIGTNASTSPGLRPVPTWTPPITTGAPVAPVPTWTPSPTQPFWITIIRRIFHTIGLSESGHKTVQNQNWQSWKIDGVAFQVFTIFTIAIAFIAMILRKVRQRAGGRYAQISTPRALEVMT